MHEALPFAGESGPTRLEPRRWSYPLALIVEASSDDKKLATAVEAGRGLVVQLREELAWATWKRPQVCPVDKVLFTPMWPLGSRTIIASLGVDQAM